MTYKGINFNGDSGSISYANYWCNFNNSNWWLADRLLLLVYIRTEFEASDICLRANNTGIGVPPYSDVIIYKPDANKYCIIDLTEIARTYTPNTHVIELNYGQAGDPQEYWATILNTTAAGLINPAGVIIPRHPLGSYSVQILPPSRMIGPFNDFDIMDTEFFPLTFEFRKTSGTWDMTEYIPQEQNPVTIQNGSIPLDDWATRKIKISLYNGGPETEQTYVLLPMNCEKRYAQVRWQSFTGATRIHIFEVIKNQQATKNAYSLLNLAGEYTEIKGREDSFRLYLDGLNAYDFWYYADILQSSKVEVCLGGQVFRRVQVTTGEVTIPDGDGGNNELEINVKWHDYDALIL